MEKIADFFTHLGWAFWGQHCDCGQNPFNGLASVVYGLLPHEDWDLERDNWKHWWQRLLGYVGQFFCSIGDLLYSPK